MKKTLFSLMFLSLLGLPLISYGNDCSGYDELISITEQQINALKMKSARDGMTLTNQLDRAYAPISSKYQSEYDSLKAKYNDYVNKKYDCLMNNSLSSINYSSNTSNSSSAFSSNEIKFMEYLEKGSDETESNNFGKAGSYYEKAYSYCNKSDITGKLKEICYKLPTLIAGTYELECSVKCDKGNYSDAKNYCLKSLKYNNDSFNTHILLGYAYYRLQDNQASLDEYGIAKQFAKTEDEKELAQIRINGMKTLMDDSELPDDVRAILDSIGTSDLGDSSSNNSQTNTNANATTTTSNDKLTTTLENMKEGETVEINIQCDDGYILNETQTKCVKYSIEQVDLNCKARYSPLSFVGDDGDTCECPEGYFADSDNENYCIIDRSLKSLSSRMKNTIDAQCDSDYIIKTCDENPLSDSCPAVCLEMYDAITWMHDNGLTIYKDPKQFGVYNEMTREQSSKFFSNFYKTVFDKPLIMPSENPFKDIDNADPTLIDYIKYSYNLGLFKGTNGKFMPFNSITKAQSLAVIIRMIAGVLDESGAKWYSEYLRRAENLNLLDNINYSLETLDSENIIRGDVALILYRLYLSL